MPKYLSIFQELQFRKWFEDYASKLGLSPDPDDPRHFYDYRGAYVAGERPDEYGHMSSKFKKEGHPRLYLNGIDTRREDLPQEEFGIGFSDHPRNSLLRKYLTE